MDEPLPTLPERLPSPGDDAPPLFTGFLTPFLQVGAARLRWHGGMVESGDDEEAPGRALARSCRRGLGAAGAGLGLLLGLSGMGLGLLRLASPTRVPSVLSLSPPGA
ncbi:hypothetical protein [Hyalangium versicolor]|uniref:hypothetical protein n=1 Tax=Hyalangium versicolor TaxID=2861190 RepID=UPI001CCDF5E5|nr:hypothetical protein [Hyalangium versicolor]